MHELRQQYPVVGLLKLVGLARSTYYYQVSVLEAEDKDAELKAMIKAEFERHKGRYGYRRITAALRQLGKHVNHKAVQRLMVELDLKALSGQRNASALKAK